MNDRNAQQTSPSRAVSKVLAENNRPNETEFIRNFLIRCVP